jgi:hypothetical protein
MSEKQLSAPELALLADLGQLLEKHGAEPFKKLAESLADPEFAARLSAILSNLAIAVPQRPAPRRPISSRTVRDRINAQLRNADAERVALLGPLAEDLASGEALPRLKDVSEFALTAGIAAPRAKSRGEAIVSIMRALVAMPTDEVERVLPVIKSPQKIDRRTLEGWNRIIERSRSETHDH